MYDKQKQTLNFIVIFSLFFLRTSIFCVFRAWNGMSYSVYVHGALEIPAKSTKANSTPLSKLFLLLPVVRKVVELRGWGLRRLSGGV